MNKPIALIALALSSASLAAPAQAGAPRVATYAAVAFVPASSQADFVAGSGGCFSNASVGARLVQDVQLPAGSIVSALRLFFVEGSSGMTGLELTLSHNGFDGGPTPLALAVADDSGTNVVEVPLFHTVDPDAGSLLLEAELTGSGAFCAAQLDYTLPASVTAARSLSADARAFRPNRDFTGWSEMGNGCNRFTSSPPPLANYDLQLPDGARIEGLDIFYFDDNGSVLGDLLVRLIRRDPTELVPQTLAVLESATDGGIGKASVAVDHVVDNATGALYVEWLQAVSSSTLGLCGIRVRYQSTAPLEPDAGTLHVAGSTLAPRDSETRHQPNNGCLDQLSATLPLYQPFTLDVQLPDAVPIARLGISFIDNDPDEDIRVDLIEFDTDYTTFGADSLVGLSSSGASPELRFASMPAPFIETVDNALNSLVLLARLEQGGVSSNLLLCNVFVVYGPDTLFADGFEAQF